MDSIRLIPPDDFYLEIGRREYESSAVEAIQVRCDQEIMAELGEAEARSRRAFAALPWWAQRKHQALELVYTRVLVPSYDAACAGLDHVEDEWFSYLRRKARDLLNWYSARIYR